GVLGQIGIGALIVDVELERGHRSGSFRLILSNFGVAQAICKVHGGLGSRERAHPSILPTLAKAPRLGTCEEDDGKQPRNAEEMNGPVTYRGHRHTEAIDIHRHTEVRDIPRPRTSPGRAKARYAKNLWGHLAWPKAWLRQR